VPLICYQAARLESGDLGVGRYTAAILRAGSAFIACRQETVIAGVDDVIASR
jgi:hypothetical protein